MFFAGKGIELRCPALNKCLGLLSPVGKGRLGLQTVKLCRLSKRYGNVTPNSSFTAFQWLTAAKGALSSCCLVLHFWDLFLLPCAGTSSQEK